MHHLTMLNWIELKTWMASVNCFLRAALTFASAARGGLFDNAAQRYAVLPQLEQREPSPQRWQLLRTCISVAGDANSASLWRGS